MDVRLLHSKTSSVSLLPYRKIEHQRKILSFKPVMSVRRPSNQKVSEPKTAYHDTWLHLMAINHLSRSLQSAAGLEIDKAGYDGLLEACKAMITKFKNPVQQRGLVMDSLNRFIPRPIFFPLGQLMASLPHTRSLRELFAICTALFFVWLVGSSEVKESEFKGKREKNVVHIKKCRFLESSNCVGMCTNLCKFPTQKFIKEFLRMPVTMVPNFEDMSCEMMFGVEPPGTDEDPATREPCYKLCKIGTKQHNRPSCPS